MSDKPAVRDRAAVINDGFQTLARWSMRLIAIALAAIVIGLIIKVSWVVLFPVIMALIVATVLAPPVSWLRKHGWPSALAALTVLLTFLITIVATIALLTPSVAGQVGDIAQQASDGLQKVQDWLTSGPLGLSEGQLTAVIEAVQERLQSSAAAIGSGVFSTLSAATSAIVNLVVVLLLTFFFIKDGHRFLPWLHRTAGDRAGTHLHTLLNRTWATLGGFIRTQGLVSLIDAVIIGAGLLIVGVPLAVPLAVITFFGGFIPIVGAFISGALALLVTLVTNDPKDALIVLLIILAVQQLEGNVLSPWLQGKTMNLHAAVVLLSVAGGGTLFGITGAFLAVPVAATVTETLRYLNEQIDTTVEAGAPPGDASAASSADGDAHDDKLDAKA